jgi:hypothetical protein
VIVPSNRNGAIVILGLVLGMTGCFGQRSEELDAYHQYNHCRESDCFEKLSRAEKTATFYGAMKIHPPDLSIEEQLSREDIDYLRILKRDIERRGGSYEAYSLIGAINKKKRRGEISNTQLEQLDLASFCRSRGDINNLCTSIIP